MDCHDLVMDIVFIETERNTMTEFWKEHSKLATVEEMMLDSNAQQLTQHELPEILSMLPCLAGTDVLELGAGIGSVVTFCPLHLDPSLSNWHLGKNGHIKVTLNPKLKFRKLGYGN